MRGCQKLRHNQIQLINKNTLDNKSVFVMLTQKGRLKKTILVKLLKIRLKTRPDDFWSGSQNNLIQRKDLFVFSYQKIEISTFDTHPNKETRGRDFIMESFIISVTCPCLRQDNSLPHSHTHKHTHTHTHTRKHHLSFSLLPVFLPALFALRHANNTKSAI